MSQVDFEITSTDAPGGAAFRAAVNAALQALASNNSGIAPPSTTYAYQFWVDTSTTPPTLKQRDSDNSAWVSLFQLSSSQWLFVNDILINGVTVGLGGGNNVTNAAFGVSALAANTTGAQNFAAGYQAMISNTEGGQNIALGYRALGYNTTTSGNVAVGYAAGRYTSTDAANQTSSNCVFVGWNSRPLGTGETNEIVIGASSIGNGSNTVTIGNDSITKTFLKGRLKLNTVPTDYADNAAALAGGLVAGETYRTGDVLKVVH